MKWLIKNPAPSDKRKKKWGDYHFGRSLTKYLTRLGLKVSTDYQPHWDNKKKSDIVLVLRGMYSHQRTAANRNALHVLWNISHPESVSLEEYQSYDLVFVASNEWAVRLKELISVPVFALLQCTDAEAFYQRPLKNNKQREGVVFVGNSRGVPRYGILWAIELGIDVSIWGRDWRRFVDYRYIKGNYLDNKKLGQLYSSSSVSLNDHWDDMKNCGFINNRVFDALACGLPIISDYHESLHKLFPSEIMYYRNRDELRACFNKIATSYPDVLEKTNAARERVVERYTFANRANSLSEKVIGLLKERKN
ncbi:MAG: glycosyltransferase [Myxococcota bacterium]|nr:glycosyltransferase [Myxococcota bacterium]